MIRCEVIKKFTLKEFEKLKDVEKVGNRNKDEFDVKDTFKCDKKMADYLTGENPYNEVVVKVIEVEPEKVTVEKVIESAKDDKEFVKLIKPKKKKSSKK